MTEYTVKELFRTYLVGSDCNNNMLGHATGAKKGADSRYNQVREINVYISCTAYTSIQNIPRVDQRWKCWSTP